MFDPRSFALNMLANNPRVANNPQLQNYLSVIQNGDTKRGEEIAKNICASYGISPEQGVAQARQFFHI